VVFVGFWLGFLVLDGATYLLLALILTCRFDLPHANARKVFLSVATTRCSGAPGISGGPKARCHAFVS
jgi:hypothetical protein